MTSSLVASAAALVSQSEASILKRKSNDVGWEYGELVDPTNMDKVKCKLCGKIVSGGVYRIKQHIGHISGNVSKCPKSSLEDQAKCKNCILGSRNKKKNKSIEEELMKAEVDIDKGVDDGQEDLQVLGSLKGRCALGPIDKFANAISPESFLSVGKSQRQQKLSEALIKERTQFVHQLCARWVYESGIPFNAIDNDSFKLFVEAVGQFGPSFTPPNQYELREPLLKEDVERIRGLLKEHEEEWAKNGCSILIDAWTGSKRSIINLSVNSKAGTAFLSSKESLDESHTSELIFEYVDKYIEQVGPDNVVQVVTDNVSNNMGVAKLVKEKRPNIFWTSCATHTINLMLESIAKLPRFKKVIDRAKTFTIFIYSHHKTLALMRAFTKRRDIVRPGVTRFASSFLTLQSLMVKKEQLRSMFSSKEWEEGKWSKTAKGKVAFSTVMSMSFWNGVMLCLKVFTPLVKVLRMVHGNRKPSMGFLYGELIHAKTSIKEAMNNSEKNYKPILDIVDARIEDRLDTPLHLTAYLLNPFYHYHDPTFQLDPTIMDGAFDCVETFYHDDFKKQDATINHDLPLYRNKEGSFGRALAISGCQHNDDKFDPVNWWSSHGSHTPNLQRLAKRILSLTSSSSGCKRTWSTFEGICMKKRNRLDANRLNNLVYVQFNAKLINRQKKVKEKNVDVLLATDASNAQGWIADVDGDEEVELGTGLTWQIVGEAEASGINENLQPQRSSGVRELHEDDFESSDSDEETNEVEFESDQDHVMEDYGEEDI